MDLIQILNSIKKKLDEILGICDEYRRQIEEATKIAKEIDGELDEWLHKVKVGVATGVSQYQEQAGSTD